MCININELEDTVINIFICYEPDTQHSIPVKRWATVIEFNSNKENLCLQIKPYFYSKDIAEKCVKHITTFLPQLIKQRGLKSIRNIDPIFEELEDYFNNNYHENLDFLFLGYI